MDKLTVLVIDDEHLIALLVETALVEAGFAVVVEHDVASGIGCIETLGPRLSALVTDIRIGSGSGWDVARHARGVTHGLPVVYMSADSVREWAIQGVPESVMIQKPFAVAQIVAAVTTLLNS